MMRHVSRPLAHAARATSAAARAQPLRGLSFRSSSPSVPHRYRGGGGGTNQVMPRGQGGPPLASLGRLFDDFGGLDVFNDPFFRPFFARGPGGALEGAEVSMGLDIAETDKEYIVKAALPGIKKEDIRVTFNDGIINISAERKSEVKEDEHHQHHYSDFTYGKVSRSLRVPDAAEKEQVDAHLEEGVLTVKIAKREHSKPKEIPVK